MAHWITLVLAYSTIFQTLLNYQKVKVKVLTNYNSVWPLHALKKMLSNENLSTHTYSNRSVAQLILVIQREASQRQTSHGSWCRNLELNVQDGRRVIHMTYTAQLSYILYSSISCGATTSHFQPNFMRGKLFVVFLGSITP